MNRGCSVRGASAGWPHERPAVKKQNKSPIADLTRDNEDIQDFLLYELRCLLPGPYAMLSAFLDESGTHDDAPAIIVGGLIVEKKHLEVLGSEWKKALKHAGVRHFHMKEMAHLQGEFKGKSRELANNLYKHLIGLLKKYVVGGAAVGCFLTEVEFDAERVGKWRHTRYTTCAFLCIDMLQKIAKRKGYEEMSFFFESGHEHQSELARLTKEMYREKYLMGTCGFLDKQQNRLLQAADILVWEMNKWFTELRKADSGGEPRPVRKSLKALVMGKHIDYQSIARKNLPKLFKLAWRNLSPIITLE
jgi:Protein of unknown function (DUF3800)